MPKKKDLWLANGKDIFWVESAVFCRNGMKKTPYYMNHSLTLPRI